jgi:uncharacterized protein YndB with AHSA1/START domain
LWEAWAKPEQIKIWWGPNGFTNTMHKMDLQEGGEWLMTMHGPDGTNFPNRSIFREIIPFKKFMFEHFNPHFVGTILFETIGEETHIDWTNLFDTADMREILVKTHKADDGQRENLEKLETYLTTLKIPKG